MRAWTVEGAPAPGLRFTDRQVADLVRDEPEFIDRSAYEGRLVSTLPAAML
jgi:hypothetical protein